MARYDKYEPKAGGFRARLASLFNDTVAGGERAKDTLYGVSLDANGRAIIGVTGDSATNIVGVLSLSEWKSEGDVIDVMTDGEVVDFEGTPATLFYAQPDGSVSETAEGGHLIGHTIENGRLNVRVSPATA